MRAIFFVSLVFLATVGCVTVHAGRPTAATTTETFNVSCATTSYGTYGSFELMQCNFSNDSDQWIDVEFEKMTLLPKEFLKISSADDIRDYFAAYEYRRRMDEHNFGIILGSAAAVGAGLIVAGNQNAQIAGAVTIVGASAVQMVQNIERDLENKKMPFNRYGAEHMLSGRFRIPPRLFIRKTLLAETKQGAHIQAVEMCFVKPEKRCASVPLFYRLANKN